jgi:hypothetical protein
MRCLSGNYRRTTIKTRAIQLYIQLSANTLPSFFSFSVSGSLLDKAQTNKYKF